MGIRGPQWLLYLFFLDKHGRCLTCSEDELFKISIKIADHKLVNTDNMHSDAEIFELTKWIHSNSRVIRKDERPITLKKFKQALSRFQCQFLDNGKITRSEKSTFLRIPINKELISKRLINDTIADGDEIEKSLIKSIRLDLHLDSEHGIDSETFYAEADFSSSEFINKYKNLLRRLSHV